VFSWGIATAESANLSHHGHGHGTLDAAQGLKRLAHRMQAPGFDAIVPYLLETLEACSVVTRRSDIFLKDDVLRWCRTDHCRVPSEVGRVPIGPAGRAEVLPEQEGCETERGVFEIADSIVTSPREVANGFIFHFGHIDRGENPERARRASCTASRRSVLTRSPGFWGSNEGAITPQA
jgi:hypothetical protein